MQETWWHIWCCDPVAMATTVQRQITPVLISINGRTVVIYAGPLSTKRKDAFQVCDTVLVVAKFNREEINSIFYSENQKKKRNHWQDPFTFLSLQCRPVKSPVMSIRLALLATAFSFPTVASPVHASAVYCHAAWHVSLVCWDFKDLQNLARSQNQASIQQWSIFICCKYNNFHRLPHDKILCSLPVF